MSKINTSLFQLKTTVAGGQTAPAGEIRWAPNTDVYSAEEGLVIKVELAGIRREDLEITLEGHRLTITGYRPDSCRMGTCRFLMMEINYGHFESAIEVPEGYDPTKARAAYLNGFLRIDVPHLTETASHVEPAHGRDGK